MSKINTKVILNYIELKKEIPTIIKNSGMVQRFIYDKVGISRPTWIRKLRSGNFTETEILAIAKILN